MDIIKALKENEKQVCFMPKDLREAMLGMDINDFECLQNTSTPDKPKWLQLGSLGAWPERNAQATYRLRADYQEPQEDEYVYYEYRTKLINEDYIVEGYWDAQFMPITYIPDGCVRVGFLFDDEYIRPDSVCYRSSKGADPCYRVYKNNINKYEVLVPTHVVFKKQY